MREPAVSTKPTTLQDVAKECGVSYQTVSRVINNHPHVAPATRKRVLASIRELGYTPNKAARSLAARYSTTIGVISFGTKHYGPAQMAMHSERAARNQGYDVIFTCVDSLDEEEVCQAAGNLRGRGVDGILVITPLVNPDLWQDPSLGSGLPTVMIDIDRGVEIPSVVVDQFRGGQLAAKHLIELGHERFARITGPLNWSDARLRNKGWISALKQAQLDASSSKEGDWSSPSGYRATRQLLEEGVDFTALLVGNDQMALGSLRALHEQGLPVPGAVSVIGFDDTPESGYFEPPLTTVRQNFEILGKTSVDYLIQLIEEPSTPHMQQVLQPALIVRDSTGAAPNSKSALRVKELQI